MYARAKMPFGQREKSFFSIAAQRTSLTFVSLAIYCSEMPRRSRARRRFGPNASRPLMVAQQSQKRHQPESAHTGGLTVTAPLQRPVFQQGDYVFVSGSIELAARRRLFTTDAAGDDLGARVILAFDFHAGKPTQDRELSDVCERVRNSALKQFLRCDGKRRIRFEIR